MASESGVNNEAALGANAAHVAPNAGQIIQAPALINTQPTYITSQAFAAKAKSKKEVCCHEHDAEQTRTESLTQ